MNNRSVRNNNPGNIRKVSNITWVGQSKYQDDKSFVVFNEPKYGYRAMVKIFQQYKLRGVDTVTEVISAWAPDNENDTSVYINFVAASLKVGPNDKIDLSNMATVVELCYAITKFEGDIGGFFTRDQAILGFELAMGSGPKSS